MIAIGTSFELRQRAFSRIIVLEPEGVPVHVISHGGVATVVERRGSRLIAAAASGPS
jgi:hypothetical protein